MNLLLLLSALLSALTGVAGGVRATQPAAAITREARIETVGVAVAAARIGTRPPTATSLARLVPMVTGFARWQLAAPVPLYLSRRRE